MSTLTCGRENIHAETYGHFIKLFVTSGSEQDRMFHAIDTIPTVRAKAQWCFKWFGGSGRSFASRLIAFAIVEGVFFCSSFAAIYWFRQRGILPGLCFSNELIARDENMHMRFACLLYGELQDKLPRSDIYAMLDEAVVLEKSFFHCEYVGSILRASFHSRGLAALRTPFLGLNAELMGEYIEYVADCLLAYLDIPPYYQTLNPVGRVFQLPRFGHRLIISVVLIHGCPSLAREVEFLRTCCIGVQRADYWIIETAVDS